MTPKQLADVRELFRKWRERNGDVCKWMEVGALKHGMSVEEYMSIRPKKNKK